MSWTERLPRGASLSTESMNARHRVLTLVLWLHVLVLVVWAVAARVLGSGMAGMAGHGGPGPSWLNLVLPLVPLSLGLLARVSRAPATAAQLTSVGLISTSFVAISLSHGEVSAHLHLFAILVFVALYQMWSPLLLTVVVVVVHHGLLGVLAPEAVFGMAMSTVQALVMVGAHAVIVVLEVVAILVFWHFAEAAEAEASASRAAAEAERALEDDEHRRVAEADAERERERSTSLARLTEQVGQEVVDARAGAGEVATAVAAIDAQLSALSSAVRDIASRTQAAASTAEAGQVAAESAVTQMSGLEKSISEISDVNQLIAKIADQTNLLALNATIEASRAGAAGRGFAVVADEVKQMANETAASAGKVESIVSAAVAGAGVVAASFSTTSGVVTDMRDLQVDIAASVEEQSVTLAGVAEALNTVTSASQAIFQSLERLGSVVESATR